MKQPNQMQGYRVDKSTIINLEKGKIPPQALDLEEVVLGAMMIDKKGVDEVIDILNPETFYKEAHQYIFEELVGIIGVKIHGLGVRWPSPLQKTKLEQKIKLISLIPTMKHLYPTTFPQW